ncbi:disks large associated protein 5 [Echinococcus multilocularis]|uniref:Disks large associated protein 5 n=1 Tax=Echinococcus multilocularis TaxID=6211 RepID=A0A068Y7X9_ECHMU|nr:disks large associated protein 5 [Echinococcus multilocularis]
MPRTRASAVPRTPGGVHLKFSDISADEIEFDDEIAVKSSVFRGGADSLSEELGTAFSETVKSTSRNSSKFILRKSTDLRKIKKIEDKIKAILASPMIEVRRRPARQSKSFTSDSDYERTPIRVPSSRDLAAVNSRRMSAIVMSKFSPFAHSVSFSEDSQTFACSTAFNRRRTTGNPQLPVRDPAPSDLGLSKYKNIPTSLVSENLSHEEPEAIDIDSMDNCENVPPLKKVEESFQDREIASSSQIAESRSGAPKDPSSVSGFRVLVHMEASRLSSTKAAWEDVMAEEGESIPENAVSSIRAAVGKCGLLLTKKFPFFSSLVDLTEDSLRQQHDEADVTPHQRADINDLLGMWAIISQQIADIDKSFERLRRWREVSGWALNTPPVTPARMTAPAIEKRRGIGGSRLPRPVKAFTAAQKLKPKGTLKRLLSPSSKSKASKLLVSKPVKRSNFSQFRAQMLVRKEVNEVKGGVKDASQVSSRNHDSLALVATPKRGRSSQSHAVGRQGPKTVVKEENTPLRTPRRGRLSKSVALSGVLATESAPLELSFKAPSDRNELHLGSTSLDNTTLRHRRQPKALKLSKATEGNVNSVLETHNNASANTTGIEVTGDSFIVPDSRPRKRVRREQFNILTPQPAATISSSNLFSPSSRPATGTPRPHLSRYLKATPGISLGCSPLSKKLTLAVSCDNSSMVGTLSASLTGGKKESSRSPTLALVSTPNGRSDGSSSSRQSLPATLHASDSAGSPRCVSRRIRRQRASTPSLHSP